MSNDARIISLLEQEKVRLRNSTLKGNRFNGTKQLVELLSDGKLPALDGSNLINISSGITGLFIFNETPVGVKNGINKIFTVLSPYVLKSTALYINGLRLKINVAYTESNPAEITFDEAPYLIDELIIDYIKI